MDIIAEETVFRVEASGAQGLRHHVLYNCQRELDWNHRVDMNYGISIALRSRVSAALVLALGFLLELLIPSSDKYLKIRKFLNPAVFLNGATLQLLIAEFERYIFRL
jgi:hypothetical protein